MNENNKKIITDLLDEIFIIKGMSIDKLAQLTDIPKGYIKAIYEGDVKNLPAAPYVRGYIFKIGEIVGVSGQELWQAYQNKTELKISGEEDKLPANRFAFKKISKNRWVVFLVLFLAFIFLAYKSISFFGNPSIEIIYPSLDESISEFQMVNLTGKIGLNEKLLINNEDISVDEDGYFEKPFQLESGLNSIEFKVKKLLGKEKIIIKRIILN